VRLKSLPWQKEEIEAIEALRRLMIEVDLERQVSVAMQSNAELDQFAHVVSHDLKEPLRGIGHFAEFIRKDEADQLKPESKANLAEISQLA
jgi:light-regulated signal transduction histidine kinase (bacteriophytochrome)